MKLTTGILAITITMTAAATLPSKVAAQNADAIEKARSMAKSLQQKQSDGAGSAKPAPGSKVPAVKPVVIPASKPASAASAKAVASASDHNQLKHVNVVATADTVEVEINSSRDVTPRVSKLSKPARLVIELPETVVASSQSKIAVGKDDVKGVRIGMDGKTPPTTSVVVDLEKAVAYDITPSASGKLILTLHAQAAAPEVAKAAAPAKQNLKPAIAAKEPPKAVSVKASTKPVPAPASKVALAKAEAPKASAKQAAPAAKAVPKQAKTVVAAKAVPAPAVAVGAPASPAKPAPKPEEKKWAMNGKRDPFFSPVVQQSGSGCSTGKKCLEIGAINLRGVVKSDTGFIAVVTNNLNKAYFLRENDPVFNGFVVKITGDSVTFQETVQDKLGKSFTREVVKRILTPAV